MRENPIGRTATASVRAAPLRATRRRDHGLRGYLVAQLVLRSAPRNDGATREPSRPASTMDMSPEQLEAFHRGERDALAQVYRQTVGTVEATVARYCRGPDGESIVHDVYVRLVEREDVRRGFDGRKLGTWLCTIARNRAIDFLRRRQRVRLFADATSVDGKLPAPESPERTLIDRDLLAKLRAALDAFEADEMPQLADKVAAIYPLRVRPERVSQVEAARRLGVPRGTLIERERKLMARLARFVAKRLEGPRDSGVGRRGLGGVSGAVALALLRLALDAPGLLEVAP